MTHPFAPEPSMPAHAPVMSPGTEDSPDKYMPYNMAAEQGLLGALLTDRKAIDIAAEIVTEKHFFVGAHSRIYSAIMDLHDNNVTPDAVTLKNRFDSDGDLQHIGGAAYLAELMGAVLSSHNTADYCRTIRDLYLRRELIMCAGKLSSSARVIQDDETAVDILESGEQDLFDLSDDGRHKAAVNMAEGMGRTLDLIQRAQRGENVGIKTNILAVDSRIPGYMKGTLNIVAGRPAMGKTAYAVTLAHNFAKNGARVLFFSLEMGVEELQQRLVARYTGIPWHQQMRENGMSKEDWDKVFDAEKKISALPLEIDDSPAASVQAIRARARRMKRTAGLDVIMIDYLGLMDMPENYANKVDRIAEVTRNLKKLAKELDLPIVLIHQMNRSAEKRDGNRPELSDLRDSGAIEQDADTVSFLYRPEYYLEMKGEPARKDGESDEKYQDRIYSYKQQLEAAKGQAEVIIAKFRQGQTGIARCGFNGTRQLFHDLNEH